MVASALRLTIPDHDAGLDSQECNCNFARRISDKGLWQKISCSAVATEDHECQFLIRSDMIPTKSSCAQCGQTLVSHEAAERADGLKGSICPATIFIRQDLPCHHILHKSCTGLNSSKWDCPSSCKNVPASGNDSLRGPGFLAVHGRSTVQWLGVEDLSTDSILSSLTAECGNAIEREKSVIFVRDLKESFHGNPVVSVCSRDRHSTGSEEAAPESGSTTVLDLYTAEAPISTAGLDLTID